MNEPSPEASVLRAQLEAARRAAYGGGDAPAGGSEEWRRGWAQGYTDCATAILAAIFDATAAASLGAAS